MSRRPNSESAPNSGHGSQGRRSRFPPADYPFARSSTTLAPESRIVSPGTTQIRDLYDREDSPPPVRAPGLIPDYEAQMRILEGPGRSRLVRQLQRSRQHPPEDRPPAQPARPPPYEGPLRTVYPVYEAPADTPQHLLDLGYQSQPANSDILRPSLDVGLTQLEHHMRLLNETQEGLRNLPEQSIGGFDLQHVIALDEASASLRHLLDLTARHGNPIARSLTPPPRPPASSETNHSNKRRKLDSEARDPVLLRYGKYGQVEPGRLRLEIVSCDGGMYLDELRYAADNILDDDDNSVYCTKGNRCNIILAHQGTSVFDLQELVIKAPGGTNYSNPVREGMIFVAMTHDELLNRTARYQIQYAPQASESSGQGDDRQSGRREARRVVSVTHGENGVTETVSRRPHIYHVQDDENESRVAQMPSEFLDSQPFDVTTYCSDEETFQDDNSLNPFRGPPNRIGSLPFETGDSSSEEASSLVSDRIYEQIRRQSNVRQSAALTEACEAHATATQEAVRAVGGELLVPHGRFFMPKRKTKCTVRFDPPVSGRYILLKIWSSHHDASSNIDIQSVRAHGYAGPRYFPSSDMV
ncbi:hypothetical protein B0I35DRAFT_475044 [Stachybotrys elegans]|uniref:Uncharacterized protein n=1 Tax=Stachybotrys elegans TaxID=80388 RepID=A0A8K0WWZ5_9HYPO|nr:hypothetical protein B0I35DRAFT_475044 [Stachybotrys elegans]